MGKSSYDITASIGGGSENNAPRSCCEAHDVGSRQTKDFCLSEGTLGTD